MSTNQDDINDKSNNSKCSRFCADLTGTCRCSPSYRSADGNGREIDIVRSFSPPGVLSLLFKLCVLTLAVFTLAYTVGKDPRPFYLAYATHWSLIIANLYALLSTVNVLLPVQQPETVHSPVGVRVKTTWIVFILAANSQLIVTVLYWVLLYSGGAVLFYDILSHGVVFVMVWIDGFLVSRIPVRARHWLEVSVWFCVLYLVWSIIHSDLAADVGNPDKSDNDPDTNDDSIYGLLDWGNGDQVPTSTIVLSIVVVFVASPVSHLVMVAVSRCGRRYVEEVFDCFPADDDNVAKLSQSVAVTNGDGTEHSNLPPAPSIHSASSNGDDLEQRY